MKYSIGRLNSLKPFELNRIWYNRWESPRKSYFCLSVFSKLIILGHLTVLSTLIITLLIQILHILGILFIKGIESLWK